MAGWELPLRADGGVAEEHLSPFSRLAPALEDTAVDERPSVEIVVHVAGQDKSIDERGVEEQLLKSLQRTEPDQVAAADPHQVLADVEMPVLFRGIAVADDF